MKLKVAQYETSTVDGGSVRVACSYAVGLNKDRFENIFIVKYRDKKSSNDKLLVHNGIRIISIYKGDNPETKSKLYRGLKKIIDAIYVPWRISIILKKEKVDILHIHGGINYFYFLTNQLKKLKCFFTCHTVPELYFLNNNLNYRSCERLVRNSGLRLIALHEDMRKELNSLFNVSTTEVIRNGIDFERFRQVEETKEAIRMTVSIPIDAFVVGNIGRFSDEKNQLFLVDVFQIIKQRNPKAHLLLVGSGRQYDLIRSKIIQYGLEACSTILSNRSDIPELLKAMDVFVFPSKFEGLGIALIEAQVAGLRCVVSNNIPQEAFQTNQVVKVSLDTPKEDWCNIILSSHIMGDEIKNIDDYDIKKETKRLESIYLS